MSTIAQLLPYATAILIGLILGLLLPCSACRRRRAEATAERVATDRRLARHADAAAAFTAAVDGRTADEIAASVEGKVDTVAALLRR